MCTANGIEHIVWFIVSGTVQPEFPHGSVGYLIVQQSVAHHGRCHTFGRELAAVRLCAGSQRFIEYIDHQFANGGTHIAKHIFRTRSALHRNTRQQRQVRHQRITSAFVELSSKIGAPVLTATLPTVNVHVFKNFTCQSRIRFTKRSTKPVVELLAHSRLTKLIALQSDSPTTGSVGVPRCRMPHAQQPPFAFGKFRSKHPVLQITGEVDDLIWVDAIGSANLLIRSASSNTPNQSGFTFPLIETRFAVQHQLLNL
ncbi:hypothetical protein SDC9_140764 [bioreactor metagenome]|uniref:Uncharacterized protein n=1 Tax=bioreactor metagenome TaxID=1076179 RepID=A0A645DVT2_9ZZZZ